MVKCTINGVNCDAVIDSGAVITIVRRGRLGETLPLSKLRVKGVTSGTGKLYGPKLMSYNFGGLQLRFPTYEGDIEDNCLIGNDFLDYFDIAVESARRKITIRRLSPQELLDEPNEVPCTMVHSPSVGRFQAGLVYYVARAHKNLTLAPMTDIKIQTIFKPDVAQKGKMESSVHTNKSNKTKDSINNATNYLQSLPPDEEKALKLGLVSRPLTTTNASLDPDVLVMSGVIPCIPAPLELHIFNASDHYVKISKSTVIAEVYLLDPTDYNQPITEIKEYELPQEGPAKVQRSTVQNYPEKSSFNRRVLSIEVDYKIPEKAPITPFEPLPDDLQDLVQRCKNLNPDQIKQVEDLLRKHHDVFAKDNTTFGCCPWVKFTIDTVQPDPDFSPTELRKEQLLDPDLMIIVMAVEDNKRPDFQEIVGCSPKTRSLWLQFNSLIVHNGLLYRKFEHPSGNIELEKFQLILPSKFIRKVVIEHHENPATGNHFGAFKTYQSLKKIFYWPGMHEDVNAIISQCEKCAKFKFHKRPKVPLKIFREGVLHGKWHVDICGPINPPSKEGYTYVLVAVEAFSGWPFAIPLKTKSSTEIAQVLIRDVFSVFGSPMAILSDQERCFTSQLMQDICNIYGIQSSNISIAHPAANGKAEKWVRTLKEHIAIMIENDRKNWPNTLPLICQAYRSMPHTSTKFSPYEVIFGAPMRTPLDLKLGLPPTTNQEVNPDHYPFWLRQTLSNIHDQVRENLQDSALRMKRHYDLHASVAPFQVGQLVWFYNRKRIKGKSPKLDTPWEGPYKIVKILNDCIAAIQSCHNSQLTRIVHMDKLASYSQPLDSVQAAWLTIVQSPWQQTTTSQSSIHPLTLQVPVEEIPLPPA
ncbi:Transposon Ty3-I Gag-Pol polyprotein [Frankliniella fusca]|uniref:RNA-directed DNA polymerase n=1 Tax=Frankliniella fusca TaxID=407009 RepID=A0AAE1LJ42_9NEOP|nr:Transposon Ty3-I Gag-Pol polyprotein [Frankliniella fusca]